MKKAKTKRMESTAEFRQKLMERYGKEHLSYSSIKHALGDMRYFDMYMKGEIKKEEFDRMKKDIEGE